MLSALVDGSCEHYLTISFGFELIRLADFLDPTWAAALVPVMEAHFELICLDFSETPDEPPVVFIHRPALSEISYGASSLSELLDQSRIQEFDHEQGMFPWEYDQPKRTPSDVELEWNRRRDERLSAGA